MNTKLNGNFGFFNKPIFKIASNIYMPNGLLERVCYSQNLFVLGNNKTEDMNGGGISFNKEEAEITALGEYVERYSSSFQMKKGLVYGSYNELKLKYKCYDPLNINYFNNEQYNSTEFKLKKLDYDTKIHWVNSFDFFSSEKILLPFFMTNVENIKGDGMFHINTTTGTATHKNIELAIKSGLFECIERDGFSKFWYFQNKTEAIKISSNFILKKFSKDKLVNKLFNNKKVKIVIYDIGKYSMSPTFVVFIFFKKKGKVYQSVGSGTRLTQKEALIKACIEAYQGIEYIELVCQKNRKEIDVKKIEKYDFSGITDFKKHYALYNLFPNLSKKIPILNDAQNDKSYSNNWQDKHKHHIISVDKKELQKKGLDEIYHTVLTTADVKQLGFVVVKVTTPKLNLLTGNFNYPYLGLLKSNEKLFLEFPHPFP